MLATAISLAGIALNNEAVNFQPSSAPIVPLPILPKPIGTKKYCKPLETYPNNELPSVVSLSLCHSLNDSVGQMCNNNQIIKLARTIIIAAFFTNSFSCNQTLLVITTKSGLRQSTISIIKNDFDFLNIVLENINPINRAIKPDEMVKRIIATHPHVPNKRFDTKAITITRALQATNGAIKMEMIRSFLELELRANIIAGTLQPNPVNKFTMLLPLIPNLSNTWSNNTDTRERIPT
jgi:hypothetical protein